MKIMIDIDDNLYTRLFDNEDQTAPDMRGACAAIRKGTPLPEGHGRLIGVDDKKEKTFDFYIDNLQEHINYLGYWIQRNPAWLDYEQALEDIETFNFAIMAIDKIKSL